MDTKLFPLPGSAFILAVETIVFAIVHARDRSWFGSLGAFLFFGAWWVVGGDGRKTRKIVRLPSFSTRFSSEWESEQTGAYTLHHTHPPLVWYPVVLFLISVYSLQAAAERYHHSDFSGGLSVRW